MNLRRARGAAPTYAIGDTVRPLPQADGPLRRRTPALPFVAAGGMFRDVACALCRVRADVRRRLLNLYVSGVAFDGSSYRETA
jgi:hypothetical protein